MLVVANEFIGKLDIFISRVTEDDIKRFRKLFQESYMESDC